MSRSSWFDRVVDLPLRRPRGTLLSVLFVTVLALFAWPQVRFEPDVSRLLPADHEHVRLAQLLDERSRPARTLWLLLAGDDLEQRVPVLAAALADSPLVEGVVTTRRELFAVAAERFSAAPLWSLDPAQREALVQRLSPAGITGAVDDLLADLADDPVAARELAVRDPLGLRWLLSANGRHAELGFAADSELLLQADHRHALLQLRGTADAYDADFATELCAHVERVLAGQSYEVFGGYTVARADQTRIRADFERASAWSILAIALYLCWAMRGVRLPLLVQLPATISIAWAIPFGCLLFGALPTVAVAAVAVLCGLGVDFAIHYAARYRAARLTHAHDAAVRLVQRTTVPELLIDMATTAATFLAIGAGTAGGLRAFGLLLALGLAGSLLLTVFALPVLLRWSGDCLDPERSFVATAADRWLQHPLARRCSVGAITAGVLGAAFVTSQGIALSAEAESLRPVHDPVAAARERIEQQLGFSTVPVVALWPLAQDPSPLLRGLEHLRAAGQVRFWSGVEAVDTIAGQREVAAIRERIGDFVASARDGLEAAGLNPEPFVPALQQLRQRLWAEPPPLEPVRVDLASVPQRAVTVWPAERLDRAAFDDLALALEQAAGVNVQLHGGVTLLTALEQTLRSHLHRACWLAALLAVGLVTWWLRSLRYGLLALIPSVLGLVATLLFLRLCSLQLSMVSFVAVPFVLGIGVDEGVHLVGHFRHRAAATGATGVGIVRTSFGTVLGFSALMLADSPGLRLLGGIVAFGSMACMLSCLFVLAPLLAPPLASRDAAGSGDGLEGS